MPRRTGAARCRGYKEFSDGGAKARPWLRSREPRDTSTPLVGMQFLHERTVGAPDIPRARPRLHAKVLIGLLLRHFAAAPRATVRPHCRVSLRVFTPAGLPAVQIRHQ